MTVYHFISEGRNCNWFPRIGTALWIPLEYIFMLCLWVGSPRKNFTADKILSGILLQYNTIKSALLAENAVFLLFHGAGGSWHHQLPCWWGGWSNCDLPCAFLSQSVHTTKSLHILALCECLLRTHCWSARCFLINHGKNPFILHSFV